MYYHPGLAHVGQLRTVLDKAVASYLVWFFMSPVVLPMHSFACQTAARVKVVSLRGGTGVRYG